MNQRSKSAQNQPKQVAKKPKRKILRKGDFDVVARGVHREDPDIKRLAQATWDAFFQPEVDKIREKYERDREQIERGLQDIGR